MPRNRSKYRADGSMRPTWKRQKKNRDRKRRVAWLAQFERGARAEFFQKVNMEEAVFASGMSRHLGLSKPETEAWLAQVAEERGWLALRTKDGRVVGIGPESERATREGGPIRSAEERKLNPDAARPATEGDRVGS